MLNAKMLNVLIASISHDTSLTCQFLYNIKFKPNASTAAKIILNKLMKYILYSKFIFFNNINPSNVALNKVTSEVDSVIAAIPSLFINKEFKINFNTIEENATKKGVFESLNE